MYINSILKTLKAHAYINSKKEEYTHERLNQEEKQYIKVIEREMTKNAVEKWKTVIWKTTHESHKKMTKKVKDKVQTTTYKQQA